MLLCGPQVHDLLLGNPQWQNFTCKNWRKQSCMWTRMLNSRVSCILWSFCPAQVASLSKSGFYCRRTTRYLLWVMTTLHIGAGRKWGVNEGNSFSHMAKVFLHFNCAAERSRLDLGEGIICFYGLWMCLSKTEEVELRKKSKFSCAGCCFQFAFKTAFQRHPEILLPYPTFLGWPCSS